MILLKDKLDNIILDMCERNIVIPYLSQERKEILLKLKMDAHTMSEIELDEIAKNKDVFIRAGLLLADIPTDIKGNKNRTNSRCGFNNPAF